MRLVQELLERLEREIDSVYLERAQQRQRDALDFVAGAPLPVRQGVPTKYEVPPMDVVVEDIEAMLVRELIGCLSTALAKDDGILTIRANYGVGTLPSLFGLPSRVIDGGMPWVDSLDSVDDIRNLVAKGVPDVNGGLAQRVADTHAYYRKAMRDYPNCQKYIKIIHCDAQGPFDIADLIWGSDIFYGMYDEPELLHDLMELITQTYIGFMERHLDDCDRAASGYCYHWGTLYKGACVLRDDSSVNLSREMYLEFVMPYHRKIAAYFDGVAMHFCGRADHWVQDLIREPNIKSVNFGYMPERFDNEFLYSLWDVCNQTKTPIVNYRLDAATSGTFDRSRFPAGLSVEQ